MRRFSISKLMIFVGLMAANFWAIRLLLGRTLGHAAIWQLLAGLLPLVDAAVVSTYLLTRSYRIRLRRRGRGKIRFLTSFAITCWVLATLPVLSFFVAQDAYQRVLEVLALPIEPAFRSLGLDPLSDTPLNRYVLESIFLGLLISGPPLLLAGLWALVRSRVELTVEPRNPVAADSAG